MKDYYRILGVKRTATMEEVRAAYRRLSVSFHPDKNVGNEEWAANLFRDVQEAYEVLGDEAKRRQYDSGRPRVTPLTRQQQTAQEIVAGVALDLATLAAKRMQEPGFGESLLDKLFGKKKPKKRGAA